MCPLLDEHKHHFSKKRSVAQDVRFTHDSISECFAPYFKAMPCGQGCVSVIKDFGVLDTWSWNSHISSGFL